MIGQGFAICNARSIPSLGVYELNRFFGTPNDVTRLIDLPALIVPIKPFLPGWNVAKITAKALHKPLRIAKIRQVESCTVVLRRWCWKRVDDRGRDSRLFIGQANGRLTHLRESRARSTTTAIARRGHGLPSAESDVLVRTRSSIK